MQLLTFDDRDQELRFTVHDSPDYYQLKVSVFNDDKKTDLIGETWIPLEMVVVPGGGQNDLWHNLQCKGRYAGEIRIELTYYDTRPREEKPVDKRRECKERSRRFRSRRCTWTKAAKASETKTVACRSHRFISVAAHIAGSFAVLSTSIYPTTGPATSIVRPNDSSITSSVFTKRIDSELSYGWYRILPRPPTRHNRDDAGATTAGIVTLRDI
jgi:hypothetical protein